MDFLFSNFNFRKEKRKK